MEKNIVLEKYFTPEISDIRVGYECEIKVYGDDITWRKTVVETPQGIEMIMGYKTDGTKRYDHVINEDCIRVPYLTKEQIEAEGWDKHNDELFNSHKKKTGNNNYRLKYNGTTLTLMEFHFSGDSWSGKVLYTGECKDVNTFRYICKLLGI